MKTTPLLLAAALAVSIHSAQAVSGAWNGATDGNWNINSNWTPATGFPTSGQVATFNATVANSTISMNTAIAVNQIAFTGSNTGSYTFNDGGGSLNVGSISIASNVTGAVTQTFNSRVNYGAGGNSFIDNNSATAVLDLKGGIDNASTTINLNFYLDGTGVVKLNGASQAINANDRGINIQTRDTGRLIMSGSLSGKVGYSVGAGGIIQLNSVATTTDGTLSFHRGIVGLGAANLTRGIGSLAGQIRWSSAAGFGDTGFAAYNDNWSVNLGGASGAFSWGGFNQIIAGQALILGSVDSTHTLNFQNQLGLNNAARTILVNNGTSSTNVDGEISGVISSTVAASGSVIKTGTGTLLLSAANTYTGLTTVSLGTLLVGNSSGVGSLAGGASVAAGAVLGGSGSIAGSVTIDGSLRPGNSIGTLTVANNVTWNGGNDWVFELGTAATTLGNANTGGSLQDQLNITTGANFVKGTGSVWTFDFAGTGAVGWYKLVDWAGSTTFTAGNFTALNLTPGFSGTFTVDGGTSALYLNVVPEPSTWVLLGLGGLFLLTFRRRANY